MKIHSNPNASILKSSGIVAVIMMSIILIIPTDVRAQNEILEGDENIPVRITKNPKARILGGPQSPPFAQMGTFLANAFITPPDEGVVFVQDSSICSNGLPNTSEFEPYLFAEYQYHDDGMLAGIQFHRIDGFGNRTPFSRKQFGYDSGKLKQYLYSKWSAPDAQWKFDSRERFLYGSNGRIDSVVKEIWNGSEWIIDSKNGFLFNDQNRLAEFVQSIWQNGQWVFANRIGAEYNDNRLPTTVRYQEYQNDAWHTITNETYSYEDFDFILASYELEGLNDDSTDLTPLIRESYDYNLRGFYSGKTQQIWNDTTGAWTNVVRDQFEYTPKGIWKNWTRQVWQDEWTHAIYREFKLSNGIQVDVEQFWNGSDSTWMNFKRRFVQFNEEGNLVRERNGEFWNPITMDWVNAQNTRQCRHFWSEKVTTGISNFDQNLIECNLMNPYLIASEINCLSLDNSKPYRAQLYDQMGRMVFQNAFIGGDPFSIDKAVPSGLYYLLISDNRQVQYKRKVVVQD